MRTASHEEKFAIAKAVAELAQGLDVLDAYDRLYPALPRYQFVAEEEA
jgi:hypothetical protein